MAVKSAPQQVSHGRVSQCRVQRKVWSRFDVTGMMETRSDDVSTQVTQVHRREEEGEEGGTHQCQRTILRMTEEHSRA